MQTVTELLSQRRVRSAHGRVVTAGPSREQKFPGRRETMMDHGGRSSALRQAHPPGFGLKRRKGCQREEGEGKELMRQGHAVVQYYQMPF